MQRVTIGTCANPAEAALVRAAFDAHDIPVVINAEHHASMLGGLGGAFVPLHIYVDEQDVEEAAALLSDLRGPVLAEDEGGPAEPDPDHHHEEAGTSSLRERIHIRRHTGIVVLLALCVTFGTAHMATRASRSWASSGRSSTFASVCRSSLGVCCSISSVPC